MKHKHVVPGWLTDPSVYLFLVPDEMRHRLDQPCDVDRVALETLGAIWPPEKGSYQLLALTDPRYAEMYDATLERMQRALPEGATASMQDPTLAIIRLEFRDKEETTVLLRHLRIAILKEKDS